MPQQLLRFNIDFIDQKIHLILTKNIEIKDDDEKRKLAQNSIEIMLKEEGKNKADKNKLTIAIWWKWSRPFSFVRNETSGNHRAFGRRGRRHLPRFGVNMQQSFDCCKKN